MAANSVTLYVGLAIIIFGVGVWYFKPSSVSSENKFEFLGLKLASNIPAFFVMTIGIVLVIVSGQLPGATIKDQHEHIRSFKPGHVSPGIVRNIANEDILIGIFYQGEDVQSDAENVAAALIAAGFRYQATATSLTNVVCSGPRTPKVAVLVKSIAKYRDRRDEIRGLVLKALPDRQPDDVRLCANDLSYGGGTIDRGVIQVDIF